MDPFWFYVGYGSYPHLPNEGFVIYGQSPEGWVGELFTINFDTLAKTIRRMEINKAKWGYFEHPQNVNVKGMNCGVNPLNQTQREELQYRLNAMKKRNAKIRNPRATVA